MENGYDEHFLPYFCFTESSKAKRTQIAGQKSTQTQLQIKCIAADDDVDVDGGAGSG